LNCRWTFNVQDIFWGNRTVRQWHTRFDVIVFLNQYLVGKFHQILLHLAYFRLYYNLAVTTLDFSKRDNTINFTHYSWVRWITCFEQFGYTWKTTRNITRFSRFSRYFH